MMTAKCRIERVYIPSIEKSNLLNALDEPRITRKDIAGFYADCIRANPDGESWCRIVNDAIIVKWSRAALLFIKKLAWKELGGK